MRLTMHILDLKKDLISPYVFFWLILIIVMVHGGCASQVKEIRENNVRQYRQNLAERTQKYIQPNKKL